jgi:thermostable 8-oxoguanine DNA glycosylase
MIDPKTITNFNRTEAELQEFLMFCVVVAGKNSHQQAIKLDQFIKDITANTGNTTPFSALEKLWPTTITWRLQEVKMGQYTRITNAFWLICKLQDLKNVTVAELEKVKGIGPKTARFFVLHSRPNQNVAVLDTHILKWMGKAMRVKVPNATPSGNRYLELEKFFLDYCKEKKCSPAELDLEIWKSLAKI